MTEITFRILSVDAATGQCEVIWNDDPGLRVNMNIPVDLDGRALTGLPLERALVQSMLPELQRRRRALLRNYKPLATEVGVSHEVGKVYEEMVADLAEAEGVRVSSSS